MTTLDAPFASPPGLGAQNTVAGLKRKADDIFSSALTLGDGSVLDLDQLPANDESVTLAMLSSCRDRIRALQAAATSKVQKAGPEAATPAGPAAAAKKPGASGPDHVTMARKRLAASFKTSLKGVRFYNHWFSSGGTTKEIKFNDTLTESELRALFLDGPDGARGMLIQPTPENNPKSNVFIIELEGDALVKIIGLKDPKGELWSEGGIQRGKGRKLGSCPLKVHSATAKWSGGVGKLMLAVRTENL